MGRDQRSSTRVVRVARCVRPARAGQVPAAYGCGISARSSLAGVTVQAIQEVRLTAFKSFRHEALPLAPLSVLIGRNSSGKSNALDGLEVLSRLARGEDVTEALESRSGPAGPVRGGRAGCVPQGSDRFSLGCTVASECGPIRLDVTVQVEPEVQIVEERLWGPTPRGPRDLPERGGMGRRPPQCSDRGRDTGSTLVGHARNRLGCGDLNILIERDRYLARSSGLTATVWTLDELLAAYA